MRKVTPSTEWTPTGHDDLSSLLTSIPDFDTIGVVRLMSWVSAKAETKTLYVRSFAPWSTFGFGFSGDNRSFTTVHDKSVTSRITGIIKFHLLPLEILSQTAFSDPSYHPLRGTATGTPHINANASANTIHVKLAGANPLIFHAPNIDVKLDMSVLAPFGATCYSGNLSGDAFPDAEVFVVDQNEHATMLDTYTTTGDRNLGPFELLPGDNNRPMGNFVTATGD